MADYAFETHDVTNQSPTFEDIDLWATDAALQSAVAREGAGWCAGELEAFGRLVGSAGAIATGRLANENPPKLIPVDEKGFRVDRVDFHPAYHDAMAMSFAAGIHCRTWETGGGPEGAQPDGNGVAGGAHAGKQVARLAHLYLMTQMEPGHVCPITMTHAAMPTLRQLPGLAAELTPKLVSRAYDPTFAPIERKRSITIGMGMTEKQGGTDVRANTTTARPVAQPGRGNAYRLVGHKWFLSAPMSDAFLMLAQAPGGLSCFFVPRFRDDGSLNALRFVRLKHKLGNHANASGEVELEGADAILVSEEGRGVPAIIEMVTQTRLDCTVASAGQMRLALALALHHARHRRVFGKYLADQPLMAQVLADMALDVEAATTLAFRLARAFDRAATDPVEAAWARVMTPVSKYWVCKIAPALGYEAMECLGGNGYVEDGLAARLYRELPLNAIWEGSGNVMCLDVLRSLTRETDKTGLVFGELAAMTAGDRHLTEALNALTSHLAAAPAAEANAREIVERLARLAAAALLRTGAPDVIADAFVATRIQGAFRQTYGALATIDRSSEILERALPAA